MTTFPFGASCGCAGCSRFRNKACKRTMSCSHRILVSAPDAEVRESLKDLLDVDGWTVFARLAQYPAEVKPRHAIAVAAASDAGLIEGRFGARSSINLHRRQSCSTWWNAIAAQNSLGRPGVGKTQGGRLAGNGLPPSRRNLRDRRCATEVSRPCEVVASAYAPLATSSRANSRHSL